MARLFRKLIVCHALRRKSRTIGQRRKAAAYSTQNEYYWHTKSEIDHPIKCTEPKFASTLLTEEGNSECADRRDKGFSEVVQPYGKMLHSLAFPKGFLRCMT